MVGNIVRHTSYSYSTIETHILIIHMKEADDKFDIVCSCHCCQILPYGCLDKMLHCEPNSMVTIELDIACANYLSILCSSKG